MEALAWLIAHPWAVKATSLIVPLSEINKSNCILSPQRVFTSFADKVGFFKPSVVVRIVIVI